MYTNGGEVQLQDTKYTDFVRRQQNNQTATTIKKVTKLKSSSASMSLASSSHSGSSSYHSAANALNEAADDPPEEPRQPSSVLANNSLIKFSDMFSPQNSYALRQMALVKAANYESVEKSELSDYDEDDDEISSDEEELQQQPVKDKKGGQQEAAVIGQTNLVPPGGRNGRDESDNESDEERTSNNTDPSTLADADMNSVTLRQELLQNIRAISGATTFFGNDLYSPPGGEENFRTETEDVKVNGDENRLDVGNLKKEERKVVSVAGGKDEFLYYNRTPSSKSKTKSIDDWIATSNREINNGICSVTTDERLSLKALTKEPVDDENLNGHIKSAGFRGLGQVQVFAQQAKPYPSQRERDPAKSLPQNNISPSLAELRKRPFSKNDDDPSPVLLVEKPIFSMFKPQIPILEEFKQDLNMHVSHANAKAKDNILHDSSFFKRHVKPTNGFSFKFKRQNSNEQQVRYNLLPSLSKEISPAFIRKRRHPHFELTKLPGVLQRQNMDQWVAKIVRFYVNGDEFRSKFEYRFRPGKDVRSFEGLCDILSQRIGLPRGVRFIYTLDGHLIWNLEQLNHEHSYVVSSTRKFKVLNYGREFTDNGIIESPNHPATAPLNRSLAQDLQFVRREHSFNDVRSSSRLNQFDDYNPSVPPKSILSKSPVEVEKLVNTAINQSTAGSRRPIERQIILVINGLNPKVHCQVLLNTRVSQEWEELVKDLGLAVKIPKHFDCVLRTTTGKSVLSYSQLRSELRSGTQAYYIFPLKKRPTEDKKGNVPEKSNIKNSINNNATTTMNNLKKLSLTDDSFNKKTVSKLSHVETQYSNSNNSTPSQSQYVRPLNNNENKFTNNLATKATNKLS